MSRMSERVTIGLLVLSVVATLALGQLFKNPRDDPGEVIRLPGGYTMYDLLMNNLGFGSNGNGYGSNGYGSNGYGSNGYGSNGYGSNGYGSNGYGSNGYGGNGGFGSLFRTMQQLMGSGGGTGMPPVDY